MVPVVLITFILFLAYYAYRRKQIDKVNTQKESDFWQRENDANSTRKQDITNLDYIQIPVDTFLSVLIWTKAMRKWSKSCLLFPNRRS